MALAGEIAEGLLAGPLPRRWAHSVGVNGRSHACRVLLDPETADVLEQASVLHDIGYSPKIAVTGFHAIDGARYLRDLGCDERVTNLVAHHSCARIEADLRHLSDELAEFPRVEGLISDCLIFCDMTTSPDGIVTQVDRRLAEVVSRYGPESVVGQFISLASPELTAATRRIEILLAEAATG